ncbi:MAG: SH3 domain-containing protein [Bacteroidota bacterium]
MNTPTIFLISFLSTLYSFTLSQTPEVGLILPPEEFGSNYQCCIAIPLTGFTLYKEAKSNSIAGCILPTSEKNTRERYNFQTQPTSDGKMIDLKDFHRMSYEISCLKYLEISQGFVKINESYWIKKEELETMGFQLSSWMDFLVKNSGNFLGYYANDPGLNLRRGIGTEYEKILTMKGDEMEISLTGEVKGLWAKVKLKQYKEHPCNQMEAGEPQILNTYEGWAKILDDSGTPNIHYYAGGC